MKEPNLFILGAQKAGTTYLARALSDHPDVFFSEPKETMFFSRKRDRSQADYEAYCETYFGAAGDQIWRAEGSTTYLQWEAARDRLRHFVSGRPRFIVCLRECLAKAVSFFVHNWRRDRYGDGGGLSGSLDFGVELSPRRTSLYAEDTARGLAVYPREDFLFLKFDDLEAAPVNFVRQATGFLNIAEMRHIPQEQINAGLPLVWEDGRLTVKHAAAQGKPRAGFAPEELERLHHGFLPDIRRTEELTGLDLSDWLSMPQIASAPGAPTEKPTIS